MVKLKELRTERGISQENLAELVGVSRQTVSKWENGTVQPSADSLMRLGQVFQLPLEAFLRDDWETLGLPAVDPEPPIIDCEKFSSEISMKRQEDNLPDASAYFMLSCYDQPRICRHRKKCNMFSTQMQHPCGRH